MEIGVIHNYSRSFSDNRPITGIGYYQPVEKKTDAVILQPF